MKTDKNTERRITEMLAEMTVEEKVGQMQQISYEAFRPEVFERFRKIGAGSFLHVLGEQTEELRADAEKTRMKIPPIFGHRRGSRSFAFERRGDFSVTACGGLFLESSAC